MNEFGDFSRSTSMESDDDKSNKNQVDAGFLFNIGSLHKAQSSVTNNLNRNQMPNDCITIASKRDDFYYNMQQSINGRCIILNFESFDAPDLSKRRGTEMDVRRLSKTFQKLNFVVEIHNDLTQQKTFEIFRQGLNLKEIIRLIIVSQSVF
ncbi:hypothetical protein SSS_01852 [Sarcoptes scabiei]|nr:hypothetical protein SSS_01852 [Sarcoptes scabiei]